MYPKSEILTNRLNLAVIGKYLQKSAESGNFRILLLFNENLKDNWFIRILRKIKWLLLYREPARQNIMILIPYKFRLNSLYKVLNYKTNLSLPQPLYVFKNG